MKATQHTAMTATQHTVVADGVTLHIESEGRGHPVALLHGFTGTTRSMARLAEGLRDAHRVIRIDLIGHGNSEAPHDVALYTMERCVAQIVAALEALDVSRAHLLGYSMGGRTALALCAIHPDRFSSALLIGASAGLEDAAARSARVRDDEAMATRIERDGVASFVDEWMALPLFASMQRCDPEALAASRADRLRNTAHGLANSLRGMGSGAQTPLHAKLHGLLLPVLVVAGELDPKFRRIAADLAERLPAAEVETIPGAGHAAVFERPDAVIELALRFFGDVDRRSRDAGPDAQTDRVARTNPVAQTTSETAVDSKLRDLPHFNPPAR